MREAYTNFLFLLFSRLPVGGRNAPFVLQYSKNNHRAPATSSYWTKSGVLAFGCGDGCQTALSRRR